jgi:hypothetical protein
VYTGSAWVEVGATQGPYVCTSTTRPSTPYEGQLIYETDTNRILVYNASAWVMMVAADSPPGLELVKTQTIGSGVSSVTVNNAFSSSYDNYKIMVSGVDCTNDGDVISLQLTTSGTASTSTYAGNTFYVTTGGTAALTNAQISTYFEVSSVSNASTSSAVFDVLQPFLAAYTKLQFGPSVDDSYFRLGGGIHKTATSYDGFKMSLVLGTMTGGTIRVYGYRNSI